MSNKKKKKEKEKERSSLVTQQVKDLALSLLWFWLLPRLRFSPWLRNFHMLKVQPKRKKKKNSILKGDGSEMISLLAVQEKLTAKRQSSQSRDIK